MRAIRDGVLDRFVLVRARLGRVEDVEDQVGFGQGFAGFGDAQRFGLGVAGRAEAGSVDERDGDAFEGEAFCDQVARRAGGCGDDGAVALDEAVEERRFSRIGPADEREGEAVAHDASVGVTGSKRCERGAEGFDAVSDLRGREHVDVVEVLAGSEVHAQASSVAIRAIRSLS